MTLTALIVDDERLARNRLRRLLDNAGVEVVGEAVDGVEAVALADSTPADLLFIDINMPRKNGLQAAAEIAESIEQPPAIVFCTAYDEFALRAFETNASAYLLKPVNEMDLSRAIDRAGHLNRVQLDLLARQGAEEAHEIVLRGNGTMEVLPLKDVLFFRSIDKHVYAYVKDRGENLIDFTLKELQAAFADELVRTHRAFLANKRHLARLLRPESGSAQVEVNHYQDCLPVSRRHLTEVKKCFAR